MNFSEKIAKVLIHNDKKIHSIGDLEKACGLGLHTIRSAIKDKREPLRATQMKIVEGMGINVTWWETGIGEIFVKKLTSVTKSDAGQDMVAQLETLRQQLEAEKKLTASNDRVIRLLEQDVKELNDQLAATRRKQKTQ